MTPYEMDCLDQERCELQQAAAEALYIDGEADATLAKLPRYLDEAYLQGYLNRLRHLPDRPITDPVELAYGDPSSNAESMAFRRAAARFGLGLYLYRRS
jgi:hypothetical protein